MPKPPSPHADTKFAQWMSDAIAERGWNMVDLASASGISQGSVSAYWTGVRSPERKNLYLIARALVPAGLEPDEAEHAYRRILRAGLLAAGFLPDDEPLLDDESREVAARYNRLPDADREILRSMLTRLTPAPAEGPDYNEDDEA